MKNWKYIDCHSHPHDEKYTKENIDIDRVLVELKNDGGATIAIGTDYENSLNALEIAKKHENVWCTIGVHPADNHKEVWDERFETLYLENKEKIVGIGECGLDYFYFEKNYLTQPLLAKERSIELEKDRQKTLFKTQIDFSLKYHLPLVIHGRPSKNRMDAYRDVLDILEEYKLPNPPSGHAHFFVGNLEIAKRFLTLGFLMSFDGPITFTKEYDEVIKFLPIENIMIETDSPYAAPTPYRGQINYPIYVKEVAEKIATLKSLSLGEVLETTKNNAIKLFSLKI